LLHGRMTMVFDGSATAFRYDKGTKMAEAVNQVTVPMQLFR
jgi:hypothetical protein